MKENQNKYERQKQKKNTFQFEANQLNLHKKLGQLQKPKRQKCFSTKILINFVPKITPKKSFCKPTFFQLNKDEENENEKSFELDKISSCSEMDDDSNDKSSSISSSSSPSSEIESCDEEENNFTNKENQNKSNFKLDDNNNQNLEKKFALSHTSSKKEDNEISIDEYENLRAKEHKQSMNDYETKEKSSLKDLRKEMSKVKSKATDVKFKETEEIINQKMKNNYDIGNVNKKLDFEEENNNKPNNEAKKSLNLLQNNYKSDRSFSILDILTINNKKN